MGRCVGSSILPLATSITKAPIGLSPIGALSFGASGWRLGDSVSGVPRGRLGAVTGHSGGFGEDELGRHR